MHGRLQGDEVETGRAYPPNAFFKALDPRMEHIIEEKMSGVIQSLFSKEVVMAQGVKLIALLRAREGMNRAEFKRYWLEDHVPLTLRFRNLRGYRVNIAIDEYQELDDLPYDGTTELWWDSLDEMHEDFASQEGDIAGADADSFTSARVHIYTQEYVVK
jgi:uncharacterized protein (TIGR02118 family)